jgi:phosphatidylglycerol---prolipoprotein diacylglyceryl transferase
MIPVLFEIGPIKVYSYGLMLGLAFLIGSYILAGELRRRKIDPNIASTITILAVVFGIAGAKLLFLVEHWDAFLADPFGMAFSPGGLTWYGGFVIGLTAIILYVRSRKVPYLKFLDALGVALILAYGIGRIGCHLSGDGDYGMPTNLPWGTNYENGTYPPSRAFAAFPEVAKQYPGGVVPDNTPLHPTPIYEFILGVIGFLVLKRLSKNEYPDGRLFAAYLILSSLFRFSIEFLRLNPRYWAGLSEAQLISIVLLLVGVGGFFYLGRRPQPSTNKTS